MYKKRSLYLSHHHRRRHHHTKKNKEKHVALVLFPTLSFSLFLPLRRLCLLARARACVSLFWQRPALLFSEEEKEEEEEEAERYVKKALFFLSFFLLGKKKRETPECLGF